VSYKQHMLMSLWCMKFSCSICLFWIPSAFQCMMVIPSLSFSFSMLMFVALPSSSSPGSRFRWGDLQSLGRTPTRHRARHCTSQGDPQRARTISVNSVSECHTGCECMVSSLFRDAFGPDTPVFSLFLHWLQFAVGRVFFQFSFFSCEFGIGVFSLS
jgi:hypothetical protein